MNVLLSSDTSLAVFQVNGVDVVDGEVVDLAPYTTEVQIVVEANDTDAAYEIAGGAELVNGENTLVVTVTAADGSTQEYTVTLNVALNNDASVVGISINGANVVDGDVITLDPLTTDVEVLVETTDSEAIVEISGGTDLAVGDNELVVTVTAADGETTQAFTFNLIVLPNTDTSLAVFQVNGVDVEEGTVVELEEGTTSVEVTASGNDPDATIEISGDQELTAGDNELIVSVLAADGVSSYDHLVILRVALGTNTDLASFTVNDTDVAYGDQVDLESGTTEVEVAIETADLEATFTIEGDFGLVAGENYLVVTVVAQDGVTTAEYVVILNVLLGTDTSTAVFQIDGQDVSDGDVVDLAEETTDVEVTVETTDPNATYEVNGDSNLVVGENTLTVTVTAADGLSFSDFSITLIVPLSSNTELASFTINGSEVSDGDSFDADANVTSVEVVVETLKAEATFQIFGGSNLIVGENELLVVVTAADGETTAEYRVTIVIPSNDTRASITVNGLSTIAGDIVTVEKETTSVEVEVVTVDEFATAVVVGNEELLEGENLVTVTVTAQDGSTKDYVFTVRVGGASADTALTSLTLNGVEVTDGETIQLRSRTTSVNVVAVTRDPAASVNITGRTGLVVGSNDIVVTVTAPDQKAVRVITIKAVVAPLSSNTNLSAFTVNGASVVDNGTVDLPAFTRSVTVVATPEYSESVVVVSGRSGLVDGSNVLTVQVTAANGTVRTYKATLLVKVLSSDVSLSKFTVNGSEIANNLVEVQPGTTAVEVVATATASTATVAISGNTGLRVGENVVSVLVTAENGSTKTYKVVVKVPLSNNVSLKSLQINGVEVTPGATVKLPRGTKIVNATVATTDSDAQSLITGATPLSDGPNTLSIRVTAANGTTVETYTVTLFVQPPSSDTGLKSIKINGSTVSDEGTLTVPALTKSVSVETVTSDPEATAVVSGRSNLQDGENTVSILVTAANGTSRTYKVTVRVLVLSSDVSLKSLSVNGIGYVSGSVEVPFGTRSVDVVAVTNDSAASYAVVGNGALKTGENTVIVRVTAVSGVSQDYVVPVTVLKSTNTALTALSVNGQVVVEGGTVTVPARTNVALVKAVTADPGASVVVSGTALVAGVSNTVSVVVTAADGKTSRTVTVSVLVTALSSDSSLKANGLKVNNVDYVVGSQVDLPIGSKSVVVSAVANDAGASVAVSGNTALNPGLNSVVVRVTAANGSFTDYVVSVFVASRSTNAAISTVANSWTINGVDVSVEGTVVDVAAGRTAVSAAAKPADGKATIAITGTTGLKAGLNQVKFTVTAEDGVTSKEYTREVRVLVLSSDVSLKSLSVNGIGYVSGSVEVPFGTRSVDVVAVTNDSAASYAVVGNGALKTGENTVIVRVTAVSGVSQDYVVPVTVLKSTNTALTALSVNGQVVVEGGTVTVPARTNVALVKAVTADPGASVVVSGTALVAGVSNTVSVVVTAADGKTSRTVTVSVLVTALSSDSSLKANGLKVNNVDYVVGSQVDLPIGSKSVVVSAVANDAGASVAVSGNTALNPGLNSVVVRVTAANGSFTDYVVSVFVASRSTNAAISTVANSWTINGVDVSVEGTVVDVAAGRTAVSAAAKPADGKATIAITGTTGLKAGLNQVKFTVTAEDGVTSKEYTREVRVAELSSNTNLSSLTVADTAVSSGGTVNVPAGTIRVSVIVVLESAESKVTISGNTDLETGPNTLIVTVTAPSGAQVENTIIVQVAEAPSNTSLAVFTVNDQNVSDGSSINVSKGTSRVRVSAIAEDAKASVVVTGKSGLSSGANYLTVTVTALSGASTTYTVTVNVGN